MDGTKDIAAASFRREISDGTEVHRRLLRLQESAPAPIYLGLAEMARGLPRVIRHLRGLVPTVGSSVILSAERDASNPAPEVRQRNKEATLALKADIRALGLGYLPLVGSWVENRGTEQERRVVERSFLVPKMTKEQAMMLVARYGQEAFIYITKDSVRALSQEGEPAEWGRWTRILLDVANRDAYTTVKGRSFAFENQRRGYEVTVGSHTIPALFGVQWEMDGEWYGDWQESEFRPGDLVWWETAQGWAPVGGLFEVVSKAPQLLLRGVEEGTQDLVFTPPHFVRTDASYVALVLPSVAARELHDR